MAEKKLSLEEAMAKLEAVVSALENEKLPLEESLKLYEEGVKLASRCATELEDAKRRIQILQRSGNGEIEVVDVPEGTFAEDDEKE
jgi:exodeoxyribonuclease VII small subunit